jgi:hypothetical protein
VRHGGIRTAWLEMWHSRRRGCSEAGGAGCSCSVPSRIRAPPIGDSTGSPIGGHVSMGGTGGARTATRASPRRHRLKRMTAAAAPALR